MKNKLIMILGIGSSKMMQLIFSFLISVFFGHSALAIFILILTLAITCSSLPSLGASPQIIRANAEQNPQKTILTTLLIALPILLISIILLGFYIYQSDISVLKNQLNKVSYFICTATLSAGLVLSTLNQALLSFKSKYAQLGLISLIQYTSPLLISCVYYLYIPIFSNILLVYCISFMTISILSIVFTLSLNFQFKNKSLLLISKKEYVNNVGRFFTVSLFGFITMLSIYLTVQYINVHYNNEQTALFSVAFQFFQIGTFLPGVLGAIFVPKLVISKSNKESNEMKKTYILLSIFWFICCLVIFYPIFIIYKFEINTINITTFWLMQLAVILSSIQAFYIQKNVAAGNFQILSISSAIWGGLLFISQHILPSKIFYAALAFLLAYLASTLLLHYSNKEV